MAGVYIHLPFCKKKCRYCDFYSFSPRCSDQERYLAALKNQIAAAPKSGWDKAANSIYFGGGTPSLLPPAHIGAIIAAIRDAMGIEAGCEITMEANPGSLSPNGAEKLLEYGVNRLSVGVQSLSDDSLSILGRPHTAADALGLLQAARRAGFKNISADLMLALPGENERDIERSVDGLAKAGVTHISAYILTLTEGTEFFEKPPAGIPDDDRQAELYRFTAALLAERDYPRYEISNFSKPGMESRHNLKYWNCEDYYGFGAAAHSSVLGRRYSFPPDAERFIFVFSTPPEQPIGQLLDFEGALTASDYIMMRLRLAAGLSLAELNRRFGAKLSQETTEKIRRFDAAGLLTFDGDTAALTTAGLLVSNSIITEFI